jgi:glucoamylase
VNPYTNDPLSVSPLTWSHATVVSTTIKYLEKLEELQLCASCHQPVYRMRRRGTVEVRSQASFGRLDAEFEHDEDRENFSAAGVMTRGANAATGAPACKATLTIDLRDCIGCDVCVARCDKGVLRMVDGKALVDLRRLDDCDLDGTCVKVCPTNVVSLKIVPAEELVELTPAERASLGPTVNPDGTITRRAG